MPGETLFIKRFGRQLRIFRKQKMLSREELAYRIRLSEKDIEELEAGRGDPGLSTIFLIAQALNVSPEELLLSARGKQQDTEYYAFRFYLLQLLSNLSKKNLRKAIEVLRPLFGKE